MRNKTLKAIQTIGDIFEIFIAILVTIALVISLILYLPVGAQLLLSSGDTANFLVFLDDIFCLVVGIEFIKMLCKPSADNVIEVLIFLIARHLIVGSKSGIDIFLSVLSVAALYGIRYVLHNFQKKKSKEPEKKEL